MLLALTLAISVPTDCVAQSKSASPKSSESAENVYRNAQIGFRYQVPFGWVDRTREMQEDESGDKPDVGQAAAGQSDKNGHARLLKSHSQVLLAVFEHPPEATTKEINSAVVIATESTASYPGLKTAEDYVGPLTEIVTANGLKPEGEAYRVDEDSRHLLRADFTKTLAAGTETDALVMHQSTLILLTKNQIVSFTFIAASDDEIDELMDGLHFSASGTSTK
jgi:hypothetical protein